MHDAIQGVQVGGEGAVVCSRREEELGEPLDCVWWAGGEECC